VGCGGDAASLPEVSTPVAVVPSDGLPPEAAPMSANNNLDVVRHDGRVYLAFRTAATHFAGEEVAMVVVSSTDERTWAFETRLAIGTDLREPRFLSWNGRLFLYFAVLGKDPLDFEPQGFRMTERAAGGWTAPVDVYLPGFIPWRTKVVNGTPYMIAYLGGESIYDDDPEPVEVHWLTTGDGLAWRPVVEGQAAVLRGGASETDFVILDGGAVVAVARNEAGDELGWGSKVCRAEPGALGDWRCAGDPRKYDSPLLFRRGREVWLIARRHLTDDGNYDLGLRELSHVEQTRRYQTAYSSERKRCSLWRVDPEALRVSFVVDLPSRGDTCFPGILEPDADPLVVYNYSTALDDSGADVPWLAAQIRRTLIYRMEVGF
jgi:hypothetical protein